MMLITVRAVIHDGKIEPLEPLNLPEGTEVVIATLPNNVDDDEFWMHISNAGFASVWDNEDDDVYGELLNP